MALVIAFEKSLVNARTNRINPKMPENVIEFLLHWGLFFLLLSYFLPEFKKMLSAVLTLEKKLLSTAYFTLKIVEVLYLYPKLNIQSK